jgi:transposase
LLRVVDILHLSGWSALDVEERDDHYLIQAAPSLPFSSCPHCGNEALAKHGSDAQQVRDLPIHGKGVVLCVAHQRYRCKVCKRTCYHPLESLDIKRLMTTRLVRYIERKAISTNRTFASISEEIGIDPRTIRNIFDDAAKVLDQNVTFETPAILGMDELHVLGAPRGVITNLQAHTIMELLEDRRKQTIIHYLRQMKHTENICTVVTDLWKPYREAVHLVLPDATLVSDKFHVLKLATTALEKLRKEISASLNESQRKTLKMHDRFLLLRRLHDLSPEDRFVLESWTKNFPLLGQAHQLKENFFAIYDQPCRDEAIAAYMAWMDSVPKELLHVYQPLMLAVEEWGDAIFAHFEQNHITGAFVESANNIARCLNRIGRGYSLPVLRARLLYGMSGAKGCKQPTARDPGNVDLANKGVAISTVLNRSGLLTAT